jgi:hypothetical protein
MIAEGIVRPFLKGKGGTRYVPSENVFVDRKLQWSSTCSMQFQLAVAGALAPGDSLVVPGRDFALSAFPLNSLCSTLSSTINDKEDI